MKQPLPLTPEQQAEQVRQFDSVFPGFTKVRDAVLACGVTADEALNARQVVAKKLTAPVILSDSSMRHYLTSPAAALCRQIDDALLAALQKYLPVTSHADVRHYNGRLKETGGDEATTYWLDDIQLITVYPVQSNIVVDNNGAKVMFGQRIVTH